MIENETTKVKNDYNLIGKSFDDMSNNNFKELENQIDKYKEELELLKLKLSRYENNKSNSNEER